ncbi:MAG TPA: hypothetical protein PKH69_02865 [Thiobacillaceae bacterium]|nr:hypothetical protein [Thiobacillaceae bacterium]HNU63028.1 hypothetical protein [Thiobacillaceae bacterium]
MSHAFHDRAEQRMTDVLDALAHAAKDGTARRTHFHDALVAMVGLYEHGARTGAPSPARLAAFRRDCAAALDGLADLPDLLSGYVADARGLAETPNGDVWPRLCMRRSALQILLDDYPGAAAAIDRTGLAELDAAMYHMGGARGPLPAAAVPSGLPPGHWWWRHPRSGPFDPTSGLRVLDPNLTYATLRDRLEAAGWRCVETSRRPIVAGEPEFALFEAGEEARLTYSFNPVCRLRLLEGPATPSPAGGDLVPRVTPEQVLDWLRDPDERTLLRGILAARWMPSTVLLERLDALRGHAQATLARAAAEAADSMRAALARQPAAEAAAHGQALDAIALLEHQLEPLLRALGQERDGRLAAALVPRPGDYALAFRPEAVETARKAYARLWSSPPRATAAASGCRLEIHIAPAGMLADDNELSWAFPGGYRAIAHLLDPHRVWVAWKLIPPGQDAGMAYDGLVWLDDHWAWFPKPYRMLAHPQRDFGTQSPG